MRGKRINAPSNELQNSRALTAALDYAWPGLLEFNHELLECGLLRITACAVGGSPDSHTPRVQMSNFRFYQDRETGDVVIFFTRYGERSEKDWMAADYYRYPVELP